MIQKKVCMVGVFGTGKTSLVQRFVRSIFSEKYHTTIGVKIDRKVVQVGLTTVNLILWDIEGRSSERDVPASYLRGAHAVFFVADGTRRETFEQLYDLRRHALAAAGDVPSIVALNKFDLRNQWILAAADMEKLRSEKLHTLITSAKTGEGVEEAFRWIAQATLGAPPAGEARQKERHAD